jgi:hypothetical protein
MPWGMSRLNNPAQIVEKIRIKKHAPQGIWLRRRCVAALLYQTTILKS